MVAASSTACSVLLKFYLGYCIISIWRLFSKNEIPKDKLQFAFHLLAVILMICATIGGTYSDYYFRNALISFLYKICQFVTQMLILWFCIRFCPAHELYEELKTEPEPI